MDQPYDSTDPRNQEYETHLAHRRLAFLERFTSPGRLLDVGGGVGTFACAALRRGWSPTLLEPVPDAVENARRLGIDAVVGGVEDLDSQQEPYHAVSLLHVLEHLPQAWVALERVKGVLRPGGLVLIEVPHYGSMSRRVSGDRWLGWWPGQHVYHFTRSTLASMLRRAGFEVLRMRTAVPSWDGHVLPYHAYILGLEPLLHRVSMTRRALRRLATRGDRRALDAGPPPPLRQDRPARRALAPLLSALARVEERLGVGENLMAVARAPGMRGRRFP